MTRRRYRYDPEQGKVVEIDADWTDAERRAPVATEGIVYDGARTPGDGVDVSSRKKMREYMKTTGLTHASDFSQGYFEREAKSRERADSAHRRETIERAFYQRRKR